MQRKGFVLCGQVIKGSWSPSASPSPPTKRNKTAAIFRFVSNSLRPWGGSPVKKAFVRALMSGSSSTGRALQALAPISVRGEGQPRMFLRQREARDNGNNARAPGCLLVGGAPLLVRGGPMGATARGHGGAPSLVEHGAPHRPVSLRSCLGRGALVPDSACALAATQTTHHVMGSLGAIQLESIPALNP